MSRQYKFKTNCEILLHHLMYDILISFNYIWHMYQFATVVTIEKIAVLVPLVITNYITEFAFYYETTLNFK